MSTIESKKEGKDLVIVRRTVNPKGQKKDYLAKVVGKSEDPKFKLGIKFVNDEDMRGKVQWDKIGDKNVLIEEFGAEPDSVWQTGVAGERSPEFFSVNLKGQKIKLDRRDVYELFDIEWVDRSQMGSEDY